MRGEYVKTDLTEESSSNLNLGGSSILATKERTLKFLFAFETERFNVVTKLQLRINDNPQ